MSCIFMLLTQLTSNWCRRQQKRPSMTRTSSSPVKSTLPCHWSRSLLAWKTTGAASERCRLRSSWWKTKSSRSAMKPVPRPRCHLNLDQCEGTVLFTWHLFQNEWAYWTLSWKSECFSTATKNGQSGGLVDVWNGLKTLFQISYLLSLGTVIPRYSSWVKHSIDERLLTTPCHFQ